MKKGVSMEKIIRMMMFRGEVFINRYYVISLIKDACTKAESLNAKSDMKLLALTLSEGIEDHKMKPKGKEIDDGA